MAYNCAIERQVENYYHIGIFEFFCLQQVFPIVYIVICIPAVWMLEKYLKVTVILSALAMIIGGIIKYMSLGNFVGLIIGQTIQGFAQPATFVAPPAIGALIFDSRKNQLFLAVTYTLPMIFNMIAIVLPPFMSHQNGSIILNDHTVYNLLFWNMFLNFLCIPL